MKKVCVITGSRAEYGAVSSFLKEVALSDKIKIQLIVTGMHLSKEFGFTYKKIEEDGYKIDKKIDIDLSKDDDVSIVNSTAKGMMGIVESISNLNPDMIFIVGDRYEIFAAAFSAAMLKVPIAHCAGGETTLGATDEFIRHSITKMSWWHFVAADEYKNRVLQLGEDKERVFVVGGLGVEGGDVIKSVNEEEYNVQNVYNLIMKAESWEEGEEVSFVVMRDGEELELTATTAQPTDTETTLTEKDLPESSEEVKLRNAWLKG